MTPFQGIKNVSIPYRQAQNVQKAFFCFSSELFQFLIGRLKTEQKCLEHLRAIVVSIPYRQAQNQEFSTPFNLEISSFNSLQVGSKLQSLEYQTTDQSQFQFLIGRLKTKLITFWSFLTGRVSIPYRQAQNLSSMICAELALFSFNSLQVGSKLWQWRSDFEEFWQFQFLIGRLKTKSATERPVSSLICFNSLQVGSKLCVPPPTLPTTLEFQFLIGRLKTG